MLQKKLPCPSVSPAALIRTPLPIVIGIFAAIYAVLSAMTLTGASVLFVPRYISLLHTDLASDLVATSLSAAELSKSGFAVDRTMALAPQYHWYVLDDNGVVTWPTRFAGHAVGLSPIKRALGTLAGVWPPFGDDPERPESPAVISVARFSQEGLPRYLYLVHQSSKQPDLTALVSAGRSVWSPLGCVWLGGFLSLAIIGRWLSRGRRQLTYYLAETAAGRVPALQSSVLRDEFQLLSRNIESLAGALRAADGEISRKQSWRQLQLEQLQHDLKGPMSAARGFVQMMLASVDEPRSEIFMRALAGLHSSLDAEQQLIAELRRSGEAQSPLAIVSSPIDLKSIAQRVVAMYQGIAHQRDVTIVMQTAEQPLLCSGDGLIVERILGNLLNNALKFTRRGSTVTVSFRALPGRTQMCVSDQGSGVPQTEVPYLFERRFRCRSSSEIEGHGLGLAAVRAWLQTLGGSIALESSSVAGSVFRVEFPTTTQDIAITEERQCAEPAVAASPVTDRSVAASCVLYCLQFLCLFAADRHQVLGGVAYVLIGALTVVNVARCRTRLGGLLSAAPAIALLIVYREGLKWLVIGLFLMGAAQASMLRVALLGAHGKRISSRAVLLISGILLACSTAAAWTSTRAWQDEIAIQDELPRSDTATRVTQLIRKNTDGVPDRATLEGWLLRHAILDPGSEMFAVDSAGTIELNAALLMARELSELPREWKEANPAVKGQISSSTEPVGENLRLWVDLRSGVAKTLFRQLSQPYIAVLIILLTTIGAWCAGCLALIARRELLASLRAVDAEFVAIQTGRQPEEGEVCEGLAGQIRETASVLRRRIVQLSELDEQAQVLISGVVDLAEEFLMTIRHRAVFNDDDVRAARGKLRDSLVRIDFFTGLLTDLLCAEPHSSERTSAVCVRDLIEDAVMEAAPLVAPHECDLSGCTEESMELRSTLVRKLVTYSVFLARSENIDRSAVELHRSGSDIVCNIRWHGTDTPLAERAPFSPVIRAVLAKVFVGLCASKSTVTANGISAEFPSAAALLLQPEGFPRHQLQTGLAE